MRDTEAIRLLDIHRRELAEISEQERRIQEERRVKDKNKFLQITEQLKKDRLEATNRISSLEKELQLKRDFIDALTKEVEKSKIPIITRSAERSDIRIGSRLYEYKLRHSKGELDHIKLKQLQKIHPDILESSHKIRWNDMFNKVKSYCDYHQTYRIIPSEDRYNERLRYWLSNQIKLIDNYFTSADVDDSRYQEMTDRNTALVESGLKADRNTGRFYRMRRTSSRDPELEKRRLIRNIDRLIINLKEKYETDYVSIQKDRVIMMKNKKRKEYEKLKETEKIFESLEMISGPSFNDYSCEEPIDTLTENTIEES